MLSTRSIAVGGIIICVFFLLFTIKGLNAADTTSQVLSHIDEILKANPLKDGEKTQTINVAQDDTTSLLVVRFAEGFAAKPHFHKSHNETTYIIRGTGQILINNTWIDVKSGNIHFNPMGKVHATRNTGNEQLVFIAIFTPAMKERDMIFVE